MSTGREAYLTALLETIDEMVESIEDREPVEPDFALVREFAEQLREEVQSLRGY